MRVPFPAARARMLKLMHHPLVPLSVGLLLLGSSISDVLEPLTDAATFEIGSAHGLLILGLTTAVKALLDLFEGIEKLDHTLPEFGKHGAEKAKEPHDGTA